MKKSISVLLLLQLFFTTTLQASLWQWLEIPPARRSQIALNAAHGNGSLLNDRQTKNILLAYAIASTIGSVVSIALISYNFSQIRRIESEVKALKEKSALLSQNRKKKERTPSIITVNVTSNDFDNPNQKEFVSAARHPLPTENILQMPSPIYRRNTSPNLAKRNIFSLAQKVSYK